MMTFAKDRTLSAASLVVGLGVIGVSCTDGNKPGDSTGTTNPDACTGPMANAGVDVAAAPNESVVLDGTASTVCDEGSKLYIWSVEAVPAGSGVDAGDLDLATDPAKPSFLPDAVGLYAFSLVVSDASGVTSAADLVIVNVIAGSQAPVADCGGAQSAEIGNRVDLDGTGSSDPEGAALTYAWSLASVPDCSGLGSNSVYNADQALASFVPDCAASFVVGLAVSDGESWSAPAYCTVTVGNGNQLPVSDAGVSGDLSPCTEHNYELDGYGSYDPEGAPLIYAWTMLSAPSGSAATQDNLSDPTLPNPVFAWDVTGSYSFELRVSDGTYQSAPDVVTLTFRDTDQNSVPISNAGADQTINRDTDCETASYVFTCDDCPAEDVNVDGTASDDPTDGDDISFLWSDPTDELTIASPNSPRTTIYTPGFASEYNVVTTHTWDVTLSVSDCADTDQDTVLITYNCTGTY